MELVVDTDKHLLPRVAAGACLLGSACCGGTEVSRRMELVSLKLKLPLGNINKLASHQSLLADEAGCTEGGLGEGCGLV